MKIRRISCSTLMIAIIIVCAVMAGTIFANSAGPEKANAKSVTYNGKDYEVNDDGTLPGGDTSFGSGTEADPYIYFIGSAERLENLLPTEIGGTSATHVHYVLIDDITLTASWSPKYLPIGNVFDGNGHTINNLTINSNNSITPLNVGFFAESRGIIKNVNFENVNINVTVSNNLATAHRGVGVVVGKIYGGMTAPTTSNTTTNTSGISTNSTGIVFSAALENVRVKSGSLINTTNNNSSQANSLAGYLYTGGLVGSVEGYGKSTTERFSVSISRSYCEIDVTGRNTTDTRGSLTGGIIGNIGRADQNQAVGSGDGICGANFSLDIDQCYYKGNIIGSAIVGGIIGRCMYASQRQIYVNVTNCYAMGKFETKTSNAGNLGSNNVTGACSGGIAGKVRPLGVSGSTYYHRYVFFKNCFVMAELTQVANGGFRGGIVGGQEDNNANSAVFGIRNCHYANDLLYGAGNGDAAKDMFMGSTSNTTGGSLVDSRYYASNEMCTANFVTQINEGAKTVQNPNPRFFRLNNASGEKMPQLTVFSDVFVLSFDANGGKFNVSPGGSDGSISYSSDIIYVSLELNKILQINGNTLIQDGEELIEIPAPERTGYEFKGWSVNPSAAAGQQLQEFIDEAQSIDVQIYAIWSVIEYNLSCEPSFLGPLVSLNDQNYTGIVSGTVTVFQTGYLETVDNGENVTFLEWQVKDNESNTWIGLGMGELKDSLTGKYRLEFYNESDEKQLLDEDFIERYGYFDAADNRWEISFRANYTANTTISTKVTAEVGQSLYGRIKIDGGEISSFGAAKLYPDVPGQVMTVEIISEKYWLVEGYRLKNRADSDWTEVFNNFVPTSTGGIITVDVNAYSEVCILFKSQTFGIRVLALADDSTELTGAALIPGAEQIGIGDSYANTLKTYIYDSGVRYRLENESQENIKIVNQKKLASGDNNIYDSFDAIMGQIKFSYKNGFDFDFFEKYVDSNGEIVILVRYVKQYNLQVDIDSTKIVSDYVLTNGTGRLRVGDLSDSWFDENTEISIVLNLSPNIIVARIEGIVTGEDDWNGRDILTFILNGNRIDGNKIVFVFDTPEYSLILYAEDVNGDRFNDMKFTVGSDDNVSTGTVNTFAEGIYIKAEDLTASDYRFVGWFVVIGGELLRLPYATDLEIANNILEFNNISPYMEGDCLTLVAVYAASVKINIESLYRAEDEDFGGKFKAYLINGDDESEITFSGSEFSYDTDMNSMIKIVFEPYPYFEVSQDIKQYLSEADVPMLEEGYIILKASEFRNIVISFVPIVYDVTVVLKLGNGTIKVDKKISLDKPLYMTFTPSAGFKVSKWSVGGLNPKNTDNMVVYGNTVKINATEEWLKSYLSGDVVSFKITVGTAIDDFVFIGSAVGAVLIIGLLIAAILIARVNQKKKLFYKELSVKFKENEKRMDFGKQMKNIRDLTE